MEVYQILIFALYLFGAIGVIMFALCLITSPLIVIGFTTSFGFIYYLQRKYYV
jgi:hypothetical protein